MNSADYDMTLRQAYLLAYMLVAVEGLDEAVRTADHAEAVVPLVDPTLYMRKGKALGEDLQVMSILRDCRQKLVEAGVKAGQS